MNAPTRHSLHGTATQIEREKPATRAWYFSAEKPAGPFTAKQIEEMSQQGSIPHTSWIWAPELECWVQASEIYSAMGRGGKSQTATRRQSSKTAPQAAAYVFRSTRLILISLTVCLIAAAYAYSKFSGKNAIIGLMVAAFSALWFVAELRGAKLTQRFCKLPVRNKQIPMFSFVTINTGAWERCTFTTLIQKFGFQRVLIEGDFGCATVIFDTKKDRVNFLNAVQSWSPNAGIYRG